MKFLIRLSTIITVPIGVIIWIPFWMFTGKDLLGMGMDYYNSLLK